MQTNVLHVIGYIEKRASLGFLDCSESEDGFD